MATPRKSENCDLSEVGYLAKLFLQFTAGASGAVSTFTRRPQEILSTTAKRAATTGIYDVFLAEKWMASAELPHATVLQASYSASGACYGEVTTDTPAAATPLLTITFRTAAGAAVDLASGDIVRFCPTLSWRQQ